MHCLDLKEQELFVKDLDVCLDLQSKYLRFIVYELLLQEQNILHFSHIDHGLD